MYTARVETKLMWDAHAEKRLLYVVTTLQNAEMQSFFPHYLLEFEIYSLN